jgi:hypothetical protein
MSSGKVKPKGNTMLFTVLFCAAALAAPTNEEPAKPGTAATSAATPSEPAKPEKPKKVCVTEAQLGSHFKSRVCATPEEWERRRERDAAEMSKMSDRAATQ